MKKTMMILVLAIVGVAGVFAQTTGTLTLTGSVPGILSIAVAPTAAASSLDLSTTQTNTLIATVTERSNQKNGYTVTLVSANGATPIFKSPTVTDTLAYSLTYNGTAVTFASGVATLTDTTGKTTGAGDTKNMTISYTGDPTLSAASDYGDTLTFTIAAK